MSSSSSRMMWELDQEEEELFNQSKGMFNLQVAKNEREYDKERRRRDDEARMGRASHSRRIIQAVAQIYRPSRSGNLDRSKQRRGLIPQQKITAALRMLAYGASADQVDKITRMGKSTILESLMTCCGAIESIYIAEYLRKPTNMDLQRHLKKAEMRGFPRMIGSIDCMHWT
ncbi:uncharacterized protein [Pyrus communis]|uniref:uncharacterized protein n=1 Tax=Pyrus communis TaxID=23211 RepID=UPI0035BF8F2A